MISTKKIVLTGLMAALTMIATMAIHIPTPLNGYIHIGDGFVLLSGIILGPLTGGLAGGIGSMLADILTGYFFYAPATFLIKTLAAFISGHIFHRFYLSAKVKSTVLIPLLISGIVSSIIVTGGYFIFESFVYGAAASGANVIFNVFQNVFSLLVAGLILPILLKIPAFKETINGA